MNTRSSFLVISSSLNPDSNSRVLAREAERELRAGGLSVDWLDLLEHPLPLCNGGSSYSDPRVPALTERIEAASGIIVATAIYNYDANAAVKNLIELTGGAWENKVVGFLCAAGGLSSYMSILSLANSLMLDFRSVIVPRFVYATGDAFAGAELVDPDVSRRVADLARMTVRLSAVAAPAAAEAA